MNYQILNITIGVFGFILFMVIQSIFINGINELFKGACINDINKGKICKGNIGYMLAPKWFEQYKNTEWSKPLWSCVRCMASVYGSATYFPFVIRLFGFHVWELFIWIIDVCSLVYLNYYFYKKL